MAWRQYACAYQAQCAGGSNGGNACVADSDWPLWAGKTVAGIIQPGHAG